MLSLLFFIAAPVPPPAKLSEEMLVGRWQYEWGQHPVGWIVFFPSGHYHARHSEGDVPVYGGQWWLRGEMLVLQEYTLPRVCDGWYFPSEFERKPMEYRVKLGTARYPALRGDWDGVKVVLSKPTGGCDGRSE